ncbi:MAG: biotin/lipoyl-containing protein, partial [Nocardioides sp.]
MAVDEALLEVSTDKVDTEIPSPVAGTLLEIKADEDETVEVGGLLAVIGDSSESTGSDTGSDSGDGAEEAPAEEPPVEEAAADSADAHEEPAAESNQGAVESVEEPAERPADDTADEPAGAPTAEATSSGGSSTSVTLPALGESVTEGTVTRWLKRVGDEVAVDEALLEVSTDKVDTEIPSPVAGTLLEIKAHEDETVEVGAELAVIGSADAAPASSSAGGEPDEPAQPEPAEPEPAEPEEAEEAEEPPAPQQAEEPAQPEPAQPEPAQPEPAASP